MKIVYSPHWIVTLSVAIIVSMAAQGCTGKQSDQQSDLVSAPPAAVKSDFKTVDFYKKYISANGLPIISSDKVPDAALREAMFIVNKMLAGREDIRQALIRNKIRVAVMAATEMTTDVPEHSDLTPKDYWDRRARGLGATAARPAISCAEENLLNYQDDRYQNESILIHEFGHTMHEMGVNDLDKTFDARLQAAYGAAIGKGLWKGTYAATNYKEYWAEGVQSYFDANDANNEQHNDINTREKLSAYDPELFNLIEEVFRSSKWRYERYDKRNPQ